VIPGALTALRARGFVQQCTDIETLEKTLDTEPVTFYVGIDPTGTSLHIGHLIPLYAMAHLAEHGHRAIVIVGDGTSRIGDPSGRSETRKLIPVETIASNAAAMGGQIDRFLSQRTGAGFTMVHNADWLAGLNYIDFLRDIGRHFSVNRMLSFETYKMRLETGLSFIEFNYQLLQSYDFLQLFQNHGCRLQIGGDDQWGNIVAGADLIRRVTGGEAFGLTFPLITRSDGKKMGKTEKGAIFLDPEMVSPYDFFQYWRNVHDSDVRKFLLLYTFLPLSEIDELTNVEGSQINAAKERLAYETTVLVHGEQEAQNARTAAKSLFADGASGGVGTTGTGQNGRAGGAVPGATLAGAELAAGIGAIELFLRSGLCSSKGEARRLITQGGAYVNDEKVVDIDAVLDRAVTAGHGEIVLRAGKKRYFRFSVEE